MNVFESIMTGLNEAIEYEKGKISAEKVIMTAETSDKIDNESVLKENK